MPLRFFNVDHLIITNFVYLIFIQKLKINLNENRQLQIKHYRNRHPWS